MTKIILEGFSKNNFGLLTFYKKRTTRIFPALMVALLVFSALIYFILPTQFFHFQNSAFPSALFFSNIYYYLHSGYFDAAAHFNFLLHTWSLSVEWQFYLLYPLLLLPLRSLYLRHRVAFKFVFWALLLLALATNLFFNALKDSNFSYFMFITRAWEMMIGGIAFLEQDRFAHLRPKLKKVFVGGALLVFLIFVYFTNGYAIAWPSLLTLIPVVCTGFIIALNTEFGFYRHKAVKYLGDISYSLYLYHWPLFVISHFFSLDIRIHHRLLFIGASFLLGILSYELIEKNKSMKKFGWVALLSAAVALFTFFLTKVPLQAALSSELEQGNFSAHYKFSKAFKEQYRMDRFYLFGENEFTEVYRKNNQVPDNGRKNLLLIGDSHAGMFAKTMKDICDTLKANLLQITTDATYPRANAASMYPSATAYFNFAFDTFIPENAPRIHLVVISANYFGYPADSLGRYVDESLAYFKAHNIPVLFLGQTNTYKIDYPTYDYIKRRYGRVSAENRTLQEKIQTFNNALKHKLGAAYLDLLDYALKVPQEYQPFIYDKDHLTYKGTAYYFPFIKEQVSKALAEK